MAERLGELLIQLGALRQEDLGRALKVATDRGVRLGETLVGMGLLDEDMLLRALARQRRLAFAEARWFDNVEPRLVKLVPRQKAQRFRMVPLRLMDKKLVVATSDADNLDRLADLTAEIGHPLRPVLARRADVDRALSQYYGLDMGEAVATDEVQLLVRKKDAGGSTGRLSAVPSPTPPRTTSGKFGATGGTFPPPVLSAVPTEPVPRMTVATNTVVSPRPQGMGDGLISGEADAELRDLFASRDNEVSGEHPAAASSFEDRTNVSAQQAQHEEVGTNVDQRPPGLFDPEPPRRARPTQPPAPAPSLPVARPGSGIVAPRNTRPSSTRMPAITPRGAPAVASDPMDAGPTRLPAAYRPPGRSGPVSIAPPPPAPEFIADADVVEEAPDTPEKFGPYTLVKRVKSGGMAEVYLAKMGGVEGFEKHVAIKRILPHLTESDEFVEMFIDEAKLTVQLNHANIAHIYDFGKRDNTYYIAMEFIHGRDVNAVFKDSFKRKQPLPLSVCCYIIQQICEGLDYAHRKRSQDGRELGIVHRDVSPANILVSYEGAVKIIDFGIAKAVSKLSMTRPGLIKGKISYMSPEQMRGQAIDRRSDVFAVGIILYELLAGRRLFAARTDVDTIRNVIRGNIPPLETVRPDVPPALARIVMKALEREPDHRYPWASEMSTDLQAFMIQSGIRDARGDLANHMNGHLRDAE